MEGVATHFHDERNIAFRWTEFAGQSTPLGSLEWVGVSQALAVPPHQLAYLSKLSKTMNADYSAGATPKAMRAPLPVAVRPFLLQYML